MWKSKLSKNSVYSFVSMLLLGKPVVKKLKEETIEYIEKNNLSGSKVAIFLLNGTKASEVYVKMKAKYALNIWLIADIHFGKDRELPELLEAIDRCNEDPTYVWIMVQLPVAQQFKEHQMMILDRIDPCKDIDGLGSVRFGQAGYWSLDQDFLSATYRSAMHILDYYSLWELKGKVCLVVWKSNLIGKPLLLWLAKRGATVLSANSKTPRWVLEQLYSLAEYVFSATWVKHLINNDLTLYEWDKYVSLEKKIMIDIWWGSDENGAYGDIDGSYFEEKVKAITPVPGWVGPGTVASIFHNIISL